MMVYRYDYKIINHRDCLTGGAAWNEEKRPAPIGFTTGIPLPGPEEMFDAEGNHRYIRGKDDVPLLDIVIDEKAAKEKKDKVEKVQNNLATAMVDNGLTVDDLIGKIKQRAVKNG